MLPYTCITYFNAEHDSNNHNNQNHNIVPEAD